MVDLNIEHALPKSMGRCADEYHEIRQLRLDMQKEVDVVAAREKQYKDYMIETLLVSEDTGAAGKKYRVQIKSKVRPSANDWEAVHQFIWDNDRFDLLQKRLSDKAVQEMWDNNEAVPGVEKIHVKEISITKI